MAERWTMTSERPWYRRQGLITIMVILAIQIVLILLYQSRSGSDVGDPYQQINTESAAPVLAAREPVVYGTVTVASEAPLLETNPPSSGAPEPSTAEPVPPPSAAPTTGEAPATAAPATAVAPTTAPPAPTAPTTTASTTTAPAPTTAAPTTALPTTSTAPAPTTTAPVVTTTTSSRVTLTLVTAPPTSVWITFPTISIPIWTIQPPVTRP